MSTEVTATDVARNLSEYLNRLAFRGERFVIRRGGRSIAELIPAKPGLTGPELLALIRELPRLDPEDLDAFEQDIDDARAALSPILESPWTD